MWAAEQRPYHRFGERKSFPNVIIPHRRVQPQRHRANDRIGYRSLNVWARLTADPATQGTLTMSYACERLHVHYLRPVDNFCQVSRSLGEASSFQCPA
jgi:hypothetical protein